MKLKLWNVLLFLACGISQLHAQQVCPKFLFDEELLVNIEGTFINVQQNRSSIDLEWRHHPESLDSFFVSLPNQKSFVFITAGDFRYMLLGKAKLKRQLGLHHLRETIGDTPLKLDDLELLANGSFLCKDSSDTTKSFFTAFSNMWWSLSADTLPKPSQITMNGARKESRTFEIGKWKDFSGISLPTLIRISGPGYSGHIWIRSAYPMPLDTNDPLATRAANRQSQTPLLFRKVPESGKREVPLILKLNKELLSD